jgi:hypothetical protein
MNDQQYLLYCRDLLEDFSKDFCLRLEHLPDADPLRSLAAEFSLLAAGDGDLYADGPALVNRLFTGFPDLAPAFPRDLLWFFGGECLHFMPDEEIALYQQLEQQRLQAAARGERLDQRAARAKLLKLQ